MSTIYDFYPELFLGLDFNQPMSHLYLLELCQFFPTVDVEGLADLVNSTNQASCTLYQAFLIGASKLAF